MCLGNGGQISLSFKLSDMCFLRVFKAKILVHFVFNFVSADFGLFSSLCVGRIIVQKGMLKSSSYL